MLTKPCTRIYPGRKTPSLILPILVCRHSTFLAVQTKSISCFKVAFVESLRASYKWLIIGERYKSSFSGLLELFTQTPCRWLFARNISLILSEKSDAKRRGKERGIYGRLTPHPPDGAVSRLPTSLALRDKIMPGF